MIKNLSIALLLTLNFPIYATTPEQEPEMEYSADTIEENLILLSKLNEKYQKRIEHLATLYPEQCAKIGCLDGIKKQL